MIKFFRKIRYNLMEQNKTGKLAFAKVSAGRYFKYAIGEIVTCPIRDNILVATNREVNQRAFRYAI